MLSRTASDLYWMSRYLERAENLARMLDVSYSLSLMPHDGCGDGLDELALPLLITGTLDDYLTRHGQLHAERMLHFFALDAENPASLYCCLQAARANAHAVRGRITADMWENINATWLEMRGIAAEGLGRYGISRFCEWVKERSHLFRGATFGTIMRGEAYRFIRLGTFIERADNTARILDVKYHVLHHNGDEGATDFYQWGALLRSLSAFEVYRKVYRDLITPARVAELLMLRLDMPRSLHACTRGIVRVLEAIKNDQSAETERLAGILHAHIHYARIEDILKQGLHEYLTDFMDRIYELGEGISKDFLVPA